MTATIIVRASGLGEYADCARRWAAVNMTIELKQAGHDIHPRVNGIAAAIGSAVHAGAAIALAEKARTGTLPPITVATDAGRDALRDNTAEGVEYDETAGNRSQAVTQVIRMTSAYHAGVAPFVNPILVERRLEAEALPGIVLSGQADVVAREPGRVRDLKTGKTRGNHRCQIGAYSLLARTHGSDIVDAAEDFVPRVALSRPQPDPTTHIHRVAECETAADAMLRHIARAVQDFRSGAGLTPAGDPWHFPANPNSKLCSARWCPAWGTSWCHEGRKEG